MQNEKVYNRTISVVCTRFKWVRTNWSTLYARWRSKQWAKRI